jgi:precorrin-2 dehydrogenase / sirohydrochlorin ferrochelatase
MGKVRDRANRPEEQQRDRRAGDRAVEDSRVAAPTRVNGRLLPSRPVEYYRFFPGHIELWRKILLSAEAGDRSRRWSNLSSAGVRDVHKQPVFPAWGVAMIPVALDPSALPIAIAGRGVGARRRFDALRAAGARDLLLFSDQPDDVGDALRPYLPGRPELAALRVLWITGLPEQDSIELAALARSEQVLVNVEDRPDLCDFHSVAEVRRGDLLLTVSTGGASPGLAARIRARLAAEYGPGWGDRLALLRNQRAAWRRDGADVAAHTDALLQAGGWLV